MYSNDRGSRFSFLDLIVKIIFFALFILVLIWLFNKFTPNMKPFYSNVFRENIEFMQKAGKGYFTTDKLPTKLDQEIKITLGEMFEQKLLLPFVDKDGNSCNQTDSYVSITKKDDHYELKVNLICGEESDYIIEIIGCYDYCESDNCCNICGEEEKNCYYENILQYQYKKEATKTSTSYSCEDGYTLKNKYCYKTSVVDRKSAIVKEIVESEKVVDAIKVVGDATKVELDVIKTQAESTKEPVYLDAIETKNPDTVIEECNTVKKKETYDCNCTVHTVGFKQISVCNTCTRYIEEEKCSEKTIDNGYTYSCPSAATHSSGSGANLKCWYYQVVNGGYNYSCPAEATSHTGSGSSLKCYKDVPGAVTYKCEDSSYKLDGTKCKKIIQTEVIKLKCDKDYNLEGEECVKYSTDKVKAKAKTTTSTYWKYKWSEKSQLSGWIKTDKTRTIKGEKICK